MNQIIIAYHAVCSGEVKLSPELVDYKLYGYEDVMCVLACWNGLCLGRLAQVPRLHPQFVDWSRK